MPKPTPAPDRRPPGTSPGWGPLVETRAQRRQLAGARDGARGSRRPHGRAGPPRHRRPSRRVRLRRTVAAVTLVALGASMWLYRSLGEDPQTAVAADTAGNKHAAPATALPATSTASDSADEDGSSTGPAAAASRSVVEEGTGTFSVLEVPTKDNPTTVGRTVRYTVEIENGLGTDAAELAETVQRVLLDERAWQPVDGIRFVNVTPRQAASGQRVDIRVTLTSPKTTDRLCAPMRTLSQVSCWNGGRSVLNLRRWILGAVTWGGDLAGYRIYLINHEVGHGLGHQHAECPAPGRRAPVMMQQTLRLQGCTPWAWPKGDGV
jgi:hypothetical protein